MRIPTVSTETVFAKGSQIKIQNPSSHVEPTNMMATNNSIIPLLISSFLFLLLPTVCFSWQVGRTQDTSNSNIRRSIITTSPFIAINSLSITIANAESNTIPNLQFTTSSSGLQYADVKKGSGSASPTDGQNVSIDYVMSTTGARYGSKIYRYSI